MGKSSLIYVIGLGVLVGYGLLNINNNSTASMDTYKEYYLRTMAHNLAVTGANIGTQLITRNPLYAGDLTEQPFGANGWYSMQLTRSGSTAMITSTSKVRTGISWAHLDGFIRDTVIASFKHIPFSEYGWFTEKESNGYVSAAGTNGPHYGASDWKITGDSVHGRAHTNNKFNLGGSPYFHDKVTARNAPTLMTVGGVRNPIYNAGYQWGITVTRPSANIANLQTLANSGNVLGMPYANQDVGLTFINNGTVRVKIPWTTGALRDTTLLLTSLTNNGVIGIPSGDLHIQGTYRGQVTVCAFRGSSGAGTNKGNVWFDGNLVGATSPRGNPNSTDIMGVVAERMAYISRDITRTPSSVLNIDAAIYCHTGEFTAERYWEAGLHGRVSLFGGVTQNTAGSLGTFGSGGILTGFYYGIRHDGRFLTTQPPSFPSSDKYELVSWWEN